MHNLFVIIPSARGVHPETMWNVFRMRDPVEAAGHRIHGTSCYRMPLDLARNDLATVFLSTKCDLALLQDDDVQIDETQVPLMMKAIDSGLDIISAPCRLRDHEHGGAQGQTWSPFNVWPCDEPKQLGPVRVVECIRTGLGAVMMHRRVLEHLWDLEPQKYVCRLMPGKISAPIFTSKCTPAREVDPSAPEGVNTYDMDDVVFSAKARAAGFRIWAMIDIVTYHDGMKGCFGADYDRQREKQKADKPRILGPDGKEAT